MGELLCTAVQQKNEELVRMFLTESDEWNPNIGHREGLGALNFVKGNTAIANLLMEYGEDPNMKALEEGRNALHAVTLLLEYVADPYIEVNNAWMALHHALQYAGFLRQLVQAHPALVQGKNHERETHVHLATLTADSAALAVLLESEQLDLIIQYQQGHTPMLCTAGLQALAGFGEHFWRSSIQTAMMRAPLTSGVGHPCMWHRSRGIIQ
eukprot:scaffold1400_cov175-Amphora_coffeaeformis.AAC.10